ncbi:MAG: hypothetical protein V4538_01630 [Bacteroidota bacterium]
MKITEHTPIHYFIKEEYNHAFHQIYLYSYLEIPQQDNYSRFKQMEKIRLFFSKDLDNHEVGVFEINFGRNDCMYSGHKTLKELVKQKTSNSSIENFKVANQEQYLALRQKAFDIYLSHPKTNFDKLQIGSEYKS